MMTISKSTIATALLLAFFTLPQTARAALFDDDEARKAIVNLRSQVEAMQRDIMTRLDSKSEKSGALDLVNQIEQQRQEIAKLRGQVEVLTNELSNSQKRQKDFYVDLDNRLRKLEPQKVTIDGKEASIEPGEQKAYDAATMLFKSGDYKNASTSFADFLRHYPESGYTATAQYLLGNAYYAQREYRGAIAAQQALVKSFPDNPKAADALLNMASSYVELKDKPAAKKTLELVITQYPESTAAQTAKDRLANFK